MRTQTDGEAIRRLREDRGLTNQALAQRAGISDAHMNRLENEARHGSLAMRIKVACALGVEVSAISKAVPRPRAAVAAKAA